MSRISRAVALLSTALFLVMLCAPESLAAGTADNLTLAAANDDDQVLLRWTGTGACFNVRRADSPGELDSPSSVLGLAYIPFWADAPPPSTSHFYRVDPCTSAPDDSSSQQGNGGDDDDDDESDDDEDDDGCDDEASDGDDEDEDDDGCPTVVICHIPPGNPDNAHTISVCQCAVPAHLAHGDTLGPCSEGPAAPVLGAIGPLGVNLGSTLNLQLTAADPNGDPLLFSASPLPLPANATLNAMTGGFSFRPTEDQVGTVEITFAVTDSLFVDSETIQITVIGPLPGDLAGLSGRVLDTNSFIQGFEVPVVGARISILGSSIDVVTQLDGSFLLPGPPTGMQVLDIDTSTASPAPDGSPYAGFRERIELIPNVVNVIDRPFFLPRIDVSSLTTVNPSATTVVQNPNLGITMTIPPNTAKNADGTNFTGQVSISIVPDALAPASLPEFMDPGLLITIQPVGVSYATPVPISFPNIDNLAPGSQANLWSLDPDQGTFAIFGALQVSADGLVLNTISGGVQANDWHGPLPQQPDDDPSEQGEDDDQNPDECTGGSGSDTGLHSGRLIVDHSLVSYRSGGRTRSIRLVYNSTSADPQPLIKSNASIAANTAVPNTLSTELVLGGVTLGAPVFTSTTNSGGVLQGAARLPHQMDGGAIPTGSLPYLLKVNSNYPQTTISRFRAGQVLVNNERSSPFGAGWTIDGLQRLHLQAGGTKAILTEGNGSIKIFTPQQSLQGVATDLAFVLDGSGSVSASSFDIQTEGLAAAIENPLVVPPDGSVAFAVVQFSSSAIIQVPLTVIDSPATAAAVAQQVRNINQLGGGTAIHAGLNSAVAALAAGSPSARQVICLSTDGGSNVQQALTAAQNAVAAGIEEIDTIGIGTGINAALLQQIATIGNGFFLTAATFQEFADTVGDKLQAVIGGNPAGEFSYIVRNDDGSFTRNMKDGTRHEFDPSGRHVGTVERTGETTSYTYDSGGLLLSMTDPEGLVTQFNYAGGRLTSIVDPAGRTTGFQHDPVGCLVQITDPDSTSRQFGYDSRFRMTSQTSKTGALTGYSYSFSGRHSASTLPDGSTRAITPRDTVGLVDTASGSGTSAAPSPFSAAETAMGEFVDGDGFVTHVKTNRFGATIEETDPLGHVTSIERDSDNLITRIVHPNGRVDDMQYDDRGNLTRLREAVGTSLQRQTLYEYHPTFNLVTKITDPANKVTTFEYDVDGNLIRTVDPMGGERTRTYTPGTKLLASDQDENGHTTTFTYDADGLLETVTDAEGGTTRYLHDSTGNILTVTEGEGSPAERTTHFSYNALGLVVTATDGEGSVTTFTYDDRGNLRETVNPTAQVFVREYDDLDRLITIEDPVRGTTEMTYDGRGNILTRTDGLGVVTAFSYDAASQLLSITDATNGVESYTYDAMGNITALTDAGTHTTTFDYDILGRSTRVTNPLGNFAIFGYDSRDNLTTHVSPKGHTISHVYDDVSRLITTISPDNTISRMYDSIGALLACTDDDSALSWTYDSVGRVETANTLAAGIQPTTTITYAYDAVGNRTSMADSGGGLSEYAYDGRGGLRYLTVQGTETIEQTYDPRGRLSSIVYPNGVVGNYDYDSITGRLATVRYLSGPSTLLELQYGYNALGNVLDVAEPSQTTSFSYDVLGRVLTAGTVQAPEFYGYDEVGNRTSSHLSAQHTYDVANRLLQDDQFDYAYDENGNLVTQTERTSGATTTYSWSAQNQLIQIDLPGGSNVLYRYDCRGRRIKSNVDGAVTAYVYDGFDPLMEFDASGVPTARIRFAQGIDNPIRRDSGSTHAYYHTDQLGSIRLLTNPAGIVVNAYEYDAFGRFTVASGSSVQPLGFTGREWNPDIGFYHYRARYYNPRVGRFISEDPISFAAGTNFYAYADGNPTNLVDPLGLYVGIDDAVFAGGGALVGLLGQGVGDLISGQLSGWEDYVGAAVGGAVGGEALLYTGPIGAGLAAGATTNLVKQGLKNLSGTQCGFDPLSLATDSAVGAATGLVPGIRIPGITAGRGSYNQVYRQIVTKAQNGSISSIAPTTAAKMFGGRALDTGLLPGTGAAAVAGASGFLPSSADRCKCN